MLPIFSAATPEIFLALMVCVIMLVELYLKHFFKDVTYVFTQVTLIATLVILGLQYHNPTVVTFHGQFVQDKLSNVLDFGVVVSAFLTF